MKIRIADTISVIEVLSAQIVTLNTAVQFPDSELSDHLWLIRIYSVRLRKSKNPTREERAALTNKKQRKQHFKNIITKKAIFSLIVFIVNYSDTTQSKYLFWKNHNSGCWRTVKIIAINAFFFESLWR